MIRRFIWEIKMSGAFILIIFLSVFSGTSLILGIAGFVAGGAKGDDLYRSRLD